jgi:hypothetical protein
MRYAAGYIGCAGGVEHMEGVSGWLYMTDALQACPISFDSLSI